MKLTTKNLGSQEETYIVPLGDIHCGDPFFNEKLLDDIIEKVKNNDNYYVMLIGDLINNATKTSVSDVYTATMSPREEVDYITDKLLPIKDKILGVVAGNHEDRTSRSDGIDLSAVIAKYLDVPYNNTGMFYQIRCGVYNDGFYNYNIYTTHGYGGGSTKGGKANKLHSMSNICIADLYIMGHIHDVITFGDEIFIPDNRHNKIIKKTRQYLSTGSCLEYGGYGEKMMLRPGSVRYPIVKLSKGIVGIGVGGELGW